MMPTIRKRLITILTLFTCFAFAGFAFAEATSNPGTTIDTLNQFWQAIVGKRYGVAGVLGTILFVAGVRFIAPRLHGKIGAWINGTRVSAALAMVSGMFAAMAAQLFKGGSLSPQLLVYGFGFGVAAIGGYNAFWDIFFPADKKPAAGATTDKPTPPITKAAVFIPIAFMFLVSSCAHLTPDQKAYGQAYGACMEAKGLVVAASVEQEVWKDLTTGSDKATILAQLEALTGKAAVDAVTCAVQAWLGPPQAMATMSVDSTAPKKNPVGVEAANEFLKKHSSLTKNENVRLL